MIHHISYATPNFSQAADLLRRSAEWFGIKGTRILGPDDETPARLRREHPEIMSQRRGAGYFLWKPHLIRDALTAAKDGDVVLYTDVGLNFISDPSPLFCMVHAHPIVLFEHWEERYTMRGWTKRDCFVKLGADSKEFWDSRQLLSTFQLYRAGPEARAFINDVCEAVRDPSILTDDANVCGLPNLIEFQTHRHDQAVLTIIAKKHGLPFFADPTQWGPRKPSEKAPYGQIFHHHRKRDHTPPLWYWWRLAKLYTGTYTPL